MKIYGRRISRGIARGEAIVTKEPITFLGGVDPRTGRVIEKGHEIEGESIKGKVLVFPNGKGSTVGSYVVYQMKKLGTSPIGMVNIKAEQIAITGAIISNIPMMDSLDRNPLELLKTGDFVVLNASEGYLEVKE